jgi:hypothetical protein
MMTLPKKNASAATCLKKLTIITSIHFGFFHGFVGVSYAGSIQPDLRCLIVSLQLSQSTDKSRDAWRLGSLYYLGKIDGSGERIQLADRIRELVRQMTSKQFDEYRIMCASDLAARGEDLTKIGQELQHQ